MNNYDHEDDLPTIEEMEEVNMTNLKRLIKLPFFRSNHMIALIIIVPLIIIGMPYVANAIAEQLATIAGDNAFDIMAFVAVAMMIIMTIIITVTLSAVSGSVLGVPIFKGEKRVPWPFRIAIGLTQAFMLAGCIGLIFIFYR